MPGPKRFALSTGTEYRIGLWFGRALVLMSLWPNWYAWFGKAEFDWESIMFGAPALALGLVLWRWAGFRLRNPREYLEIDREAGVARLVRVNVEPVVCKLDALGDWRFDTFTTSHVSKGTRVTTTWHGVQCPGFGQRHLFSSEDPNARRRWCARVDAAARPFIDDNGFDYDRDVVAATLARHGLHDEGELLWTATGLVADGVRRLDPATLEAAARSLTHTSVAVRVGEQLDDATTSLGGLAWGFLFAGSGAVAALSIHPLEQTSGGRVEAVVLIALAYAGVAIGWRAIQRPVIGAIVATLGGASLIAKPWYAPVSHFYDGAFHPLSPTSETHLYYVIPGLGLIVVAVWLVSTLQVRKPAAAPPRPRVDAIELPRPEPPKPPSNG